MTVVWILSPCARSFAWTAIALALASTNEANAADAGAPLRAPIADGGVPKGKLPCGDKSAVTFLARPTYADHIAAKENFTARAWVGNDSSCPVAVEFLLGFTPPATTATRSLMAPTEIPSGGAFVDILASNEQLKKANVTTGRYAITFALFDATGARVGDDYSGNPFRFGEDQVSMTMASLPKIIAQKDDLRAWFTFKNVGDSPNKMTALIVFTRPGATAGIEHYVHDLVVLPGTSTQEVVLTPEGREKIAVSGGSWLVTLTSFDAAGDRLQSISGQPLTIGRLNVRLGGRPKYPKSVSTTDALVVDVPFSNWGDIDDKANVVLTFARPGKGGAGNDHELTIPVTVGPGNTTVKVTLTAEERRRKGLTAGPWAVSATAFNSGGERLEYYGGDVVQITDPPKP